MFIKAFANFYYFPCCTFYMSYSACFILQTTQKLSDTDTIHTKSWSWFFSTVIGIQVFSNNTRYLLGDYPHPSLMKILDTITTWSVEQSGPITAFLMQWEKVANASSSESILHANYGSLSKIIQSFQKMI